MKKREDMSEMELLIRLDERVESMHSSWPSLWRAIRRHDRELLIAKVLLVVVVLVAASAHPWVSNAIAGLFK